MNMSFATTRPLLPPDVSGNRYTASGPTRSVSRALGAIAYSGLRQQDPRTICKTQWPDDASALALVRSTIGVTSTASSGVDSLLGHALSIASVAPQSAASKLFSRCVRLNFEGIHRIGMANATTIPEGGFAGEGSPHVVAEGEFENTIVGPCHKLLVSCVITRELENAAPESFSAIVSRILSGKAAVTLDVFDDQAASSTRP